jgi:maleate isomerase
MTTATELTRLRPLRYGTRGRIALIVPYDNAVIEPELATALPDGVTGNVLRILRCSPDAMVAGALTLATGAPDLGASAVLYTCVASVCLQGVTEDEKFCRDLAATARMPARTATASMVDALHALEVRRLALLLPYPEMKCLAVRRYFGAHGFEVVADHRLGLEPEAINNLSPRDVFEAARQVPTENADALLLVSTNLPTLEALPFLQDLYSIPVLSTNAALAWNGLRLLGLAPAAIARRRIMDAIREA